MDERVSPRGTAACPFLLPLPPLPPLCLRLSIDLRLRLPVGRPRCGLLGRLPSRLRLRLPRGRLGGRKTGPGGPHSQGWWTNCGGQSPPLGNVRCGGDGKDKERESPVPTWDTVSRSLKLQTNFCGGRARYWNSSWNPHRSPEICAGI